MLVGLSSIHHPRSTIMCSSASATFSLAGLLIALSPMEQKEQPTLDEVLDDIEGEQDTFHTNTANPPASDTTNDGDNYANQEYSEDEDDLAEADNAGASTLRMEALNETILNASKGVSEKTAGEYEGCTERILF